MRLGVLLVALTGVNVYVFFFRDDTAVRKVLKPSSTGKLLVDERRKALEQIPRSLTGAGSARKEAAEVMGQGEGTGPQTDGRVVEGKIGPSEALVTVLAREGLDSATAANVAKALGKAVDPKSIR